MEDYLVPEETFNNRFSICKNCINLKENVCMLCGCHMDSKCWVKYAVCPEGKW